MKGKKKAEKKVELLDDQATIEQISTKDIPDNQKTKAINIYPDFS